jgi:integrase
LKTLLLTGARRNEVAGMTRSELGKIIIERDGRSQEIHLWEIPAARYKTKRPHTLPLSAAALELIEAQPECRHGFVFPSSTGTAFTGFGKSKAALDKAILAAIGAGAPKGENVKPLPRWTLHDLRRTAKTLMQRAGVRPDISERVLGHVLKGVEGTYDRHSYAAEKLDALEALAGIIERIVMPRPTNVTDLGQHRAAGHQ